MAVSFANSRVESVQRSQQSSWLHDENCKGALANNIHKIEWPRVEMRGGATDSHVFRVTGRGERGGKVALKTSRINILGMGP